MRTLLVLLLATLPLTQARAEATPSGGGERYILVDQDVCAGLTAHRPLDDVAYQPGVDASGNDVAPADLDGQGGLDLGPDHTYRLDIAVPLNEAIEIDPDGALGSVDDSDINVGTVTVSNGEVRFNGRPLGSAEAHAVAEACAALQATRRDE